jgi:multiple sugar transport system permease protein
VSSSARPTRTKRRGRPLLATLVGVETTFQARWSVWGYVFALPWLLGLVIFWLGPIFASFYLSFTKYDVLSPPEFIGLENFRVAFFEDKLFWASVGRTFEYSLITVPLGLIGSLALAALLNRPARGVSLFRALFFLPSLIPAVALALLWVWLFDTNLGLINFALQVVGITGPGWFTSEQWSMPALVIIYVWSAWGGSTMLIFLAGLQGVDRTLLEVAQIDGAGRWATFRHVTLPMISPTIFFNFVLGVIAGLQVFTIAYVATEGGPSYTTWFYALHIYNHAFSYLELGYGSALAWLFVVALLAFTYVQLRLSRRWVYYGGGSEQW